MQERLKMTRGIAVLLATTLLTAGLLLPGFASAGSLTNTYVRLDRMKAGSTSTVRVVFTTSATAAVDDNITIDFNGADTTTWTGAGGVVNATQTVSSTACNAATGAAVLPGTPTAGGSGSVVTVSGLTDLASSTAYCFDLTSSTAVTLPSAGEFHPVIRLKTSATVNDSVTVAVRVIADDQVTVTATVPASFNFQLDSNTTAFTDVLTAGTKRQTTARTITINSNGKSGWNAWLKNGDANGLYSATVAKNIAPTTPGTAVDIDASLSTEQYVWGVSALTQGSGAGTATIPAAYDATGAANEGSGVDQSYREIAFSNGTAANAVVTIRSSATVSAITPAAGDYTDTIIVIGSGQF